MNKGLLLVCSLLTLAFPKIVSGQPQEEDAIRLAKNLKGNVVQIFAKYQNEQETQGMGFVIGEQANGQDTVLYVLTAFHVIVPEKLWEINDTIVYRFFMEPYQAQLEKITVNFEHDKENKISATFISQGVFKNQLDLALLTIPKPLGLKWERYCLADSSKINSITTKAFYFDFQEEEGIPPTDDWGNFLSRNGDWRPTKVNSTMETKSGGPIMSSFGIEGIWIKKETEGARGYHQGTIKQWFQEDSKLKRNHPNAFQLKQKEPIPELVKKIEYREIPQRVRRSLWGGAGLALVSAGLLEMGASRDYQIYEDNLVEDPTLFEGKDRATWYGNANRRHQIAQGLLAGGIVLLVGSLSDKKGSPLRGLYKKVSYEAPIPLRQGSLRLQPDLIDSTSPFFPPSPTAGFSLAWTF